MPILISNTGLNGRLKVSGNSTGGFKARYVVPSLLLDTYPGAAAAYSLRKLRTAYTGAAIRVRRDRDNTEQDIGFNLLGELDTVALQSFVGSENYVFWSQDFTQSIWTKTAVTVTANAGTAPDGTNTAQKCVPSAAVTTKAIFQNIPSVSTRDYVFSMYAKAAEYNYMQLLAIRDSSNRYSIIVDLTTGAITQTNTVGTPNFINSSVTSVGNGWYRIVITLNINLGTNYFVFSPSPISNPTLNGSLDLQSAGNGTSGVLFWGAQLNYFALRPYQVTTTTQSILANGFISIWYDQSGNTRNASQSTTANQPQIVNSGAIISVNGKPALQVDNTDSLTFTAITIPLRTTFGVIKRTAIDTNFFIYGGGVSHYHFNNRFYFEVVTRVLGSNSVDNTSSQMLLSGYNSSDSLAFQYKNNVLISSTLSSQVFATSINSLFFYGGSLYSQGNAQEIIIYATDNNANISGINTNINSYYSIY